MSEKLDDLSLCPFGTHRGKAMQDVPASWLIWFYNEVWEEEDLGMEPEGYRLAVYDYVKRSIHALHMECPKMEILGLDELENEESGEREDIKPGIEEIKEDGIDNENGIGNCYSSDEEETD